jgi:hypothetical protein
LSCETTLPLDDLRRIFNRENGSWLDLGIKLFAGLVDNGPWFTADIGLLLFHGVRFMLVVGSAGSLSLGDDLFSSSLLGQSLLVS